MRRAGVVLAATVLTVAVTGTAYAAGSPASPSASCVATITSYEASELEPGAVGAEVSGLATSSPGAVGGFVKDLAKTHAGSIGACFEEER